MVALRRQGVLVPLLGLLACQAPFSAEEGLVGEGPMWPFPSVTLEDPVTGTLAIPGDAVPMPDGGTALPVAELAWRTGFSPGQPMLARLPQANALALPSWLSPTPGDGGAQLYDLDAGLALPVMAELDAWCGQNLGDLACEGAPDTVILRPLVALPDGHRVAAVLTTDVAPRPEPYDALLRQRGDVPEHQRALHERLSELGVAESSIALAWDFPVQRARLPLQSALDAVQTPTSWSFTVVRDADRGDPLPPGIWRALEGTLGITDVLVEDLTLDQASDGTVRSTGQAQAYMVVLLPDSLRHAPANSAPLLLFGHGIFSHPRDYLLDRTDHQQVAAVANHLGAAVIATTWRGLNADDRLEAVQVAQDFGRFPLVPGRVVQGQVAFDSLLRVAPALFADPQLAGQDGQVLVSGEEVLYYGISLGGIEGTVLAATHPQLEAAALHVPGGMWGSMLERSSDWRVFDAIVPRMVADPADRQLLYALSQLWWDPVDPVNYTAELGGRSLLFQEAIGDEQVANMSTEVIVRSAGVPVAEPLVRPPFAVDAVALPTTGPVLVQLDPQLPVPTDHNRPAATTGAHTDPRTWPGTRQQVEHFLAKSTRGEVIHPCGDAPCSADNPGVEAP